MMTTFQNRSRAKRTNSYWYICLLFFATFTLFLTPISAQSTPDVVTDVCDPDQGPVTCTACASGSSVINTMTNLPRPNVALKPTPRNFAFYDDLYSCFSASTTIPCIFDTITIDDITKTPADSHSAANYANSLFLYAVAGAVFTVIVFLYFIALCCGRYLCGCCTPGGLGCCASSFPTRKDDPETRRCCCSCLGFVADNEELTGFSYPCWEKLLAHAWAWIYAILMVIFVILMATLGVDGVEKSAYKIAHSPDNLVRAIGSTAETVNNTLSSVIQNTFSDGAVKIAQTVIVEGQVDNFIITNNKFVDAIRDFTDTTQTQANLGNLADSTTILKDAADMYITPSASLYTAAKAVNDAYQKVSGTDTFSSTLENYSDAMRAALPGASIFVDKVFVASQVFPNTVTEMHNFKIASEDIDSIALVKSAGETALVDLAQFRSSATLAGQTAVMSQLKSLFDTAQGDGLTLKSKIADVKNKIAAALPVIGALKDFLIALKSSSKAADALVLVDQAAWPFVPSTADFAALDNAAGKLSDQYNANASSLSTTITAFASTIAPNTRQASQDVQSGSLLTEEFAVSKAASLMFPGLVTSVFNHIDILRDKIYKIPIEVSSALDFIRSLPDDSQDYIASVEDANTTLQATLSKMENEGFSFEVMYNNLNALSDLYVKHFNNPTSADHVTKASQVLQNANLLQAQLKDFYSDQSANYDLSRLASFIQLLNSKIDAVLPKETIDSRIEDMTVLQSTLNAFDDVLFTQKVDDVLSKITQFLTSGRGYCSNDQAKICDRVAGTGCATAATCVSVARVCYSATDGAPTMMACHFDSSCASFGAGSYCIAGAEQMSSVTTGLLDSLVTFDSNKANHAYDMTLTIKEIFSITPIAPTSDLDAVISDLNSYTATSGSLFSYYDFAGQGIEKIERTVLTQAHAYNLLITLTAFSQTFAQLNTGFKSALADAVVLAQTMEDIRNKSIAEIVDVNGFLSIPTTCVLPFGEEIILYDWKNELIQSGPRAVLELLSTRINSLATCVNNQQDMWAIVLPVLSPENIDKASDIIEKYYEIADVSSLGWPGSIYQLLQLANFDMVDKSAPNTNRIDVDASGVQYEMSRLCLTNDCIDTTIDFYLNQNLSTSIDVPLSISPKNIPLVLMIFPLLIAALLILSSCCGLCGRGCQKCSVHLSNCSLCIMFCQNVLGFIVVGIALFPALMAFSDTCQSAANLGDRYLAEKVEDLCVTNIGGLYNPSTEICSYSSVAYDLNLNFNMRGMYRAILSNSCSVTDSVTRVFDQVSEQASTMISNEADKLFRTGYALESFQPTFQASFISFSLNVGTEVTSIVNSLSTQVGCTGIASATTDFTASVCCETASGFYWIIAGWYWLLWFTCFCGVPAALLGRKRFPRQPWGKEFEEALAQAQNANFPKNSASVAPEGYVYSEVNYNTGVYVAPSNAPGSPAASYI